MNTKSNHISGNGADDASRAANPVTNNRHACGQGGLAVVKDSEFFTDTEHGPYRAWGICNLTCATDEISMAVGVMPPHTEGQFHAHHDTDTALYILAGRVVAEWIDEDGNTRRSEASAGEFIFIPKGVVHRPVNSFNAAMGYVVARSVAHAD